MKVNIYIIVLVSVDDKCELTNLKYDSETRSFEAFYGNDNTHISDEDLNKVKKAIEISEEDFETFKEEIKKFNISINSNFELIKLLSEQFDNSKNANIKLKRIGN